VTNIIKFAHRSNRGSSTEKIITLHLYLEGASYLTCHFRATTSSIIKVRAEAKKRGIKLAQTHLELLIVSLWNKKSYHNGLNFQQKLRSATTLTWLENSTIPLEKIITEKLNLHFALLYYKKSIARKGHPRSLILVTSNSELYPEDIQESIQAQILSDRKNYPHLFKTAKILVFE